VKRIYYNAKLEALFIIAFIDLSYWRFSAATEKLDTAAFEALLLTTGVFELLFVLKILILEILIMTPFATLPFLNHLRSLTLEAPCILLLLSWNAITLA
jgi:hypothetical protein